MSITGRYRPRAWSGSIGPAPSAAPPPASSSPKSRAELARGHRRGRRPGARAGAGHSFNGGTITEGTLIWLDALTRVLDADPATGRVRVEAGIRLHALSRELHARGLAMENLGDIDAQSLAGAISTGTHGTGTRYPNLSGQIEASSWSWPTAARGLSDGDQLRAARVSVGALGVIAAVTLRCVPAFRLRNVDRPEPLDDVLADSRTRRRARPLRVLGLPARGRRAHAHARGDRGPADRAAAPRLHERRPDGQPRVPRRERGRAALPARDPAAEPLRLAVASQRERVDWSYGIFASQRLVRFEEMEYAVPREHAVEAVLTAQGGARAPPGLVPDRAAFQRRRRRTALSRARARESRSSPSTCSAGWRTSSRSARSRRRSARRRPPALGQALFLTRPNSRRAIRAGTPSRPSAHALDPEGRFANAWVRTCWDSAHGVFNVFDVELRSTTPRIRRATGRGEPLRARRSAPRSIGKLYELPPGQACARTTGRPRRSGCSCSRASSRFATPTART